MSAPIHAEAEHPWRLLMVLAVTLMMNGQVMAETVRMPAQESAVNACTASFDEVMHPDELGFATEGTLTLFFATGRSVLGHEARRALDRAVPLILDHLASGGSVLINGHADALGHPDENQSLSLRRAEAVSVYLSEAWGIPTRRLSLRAWGTSHPGGAEPPRTAENRRVVITLQPGRSTPGSLRFDHHRTGLRSVQPGHLDLDDFGGGRNPLPGSLIRIWPSPHQPRN